MGGAVTDTDARNRATSAAEVKAWHEDPPNKAFVYVKQERAKIATWMGDELGDIVQWGKPWRSSLGDMRQSIRVRATNGREYAGTYFCSAGDYARISMCKGGAL